MLALNHVILYLPEFGVYDDPTANFAAFGVLAPENYDKPVVRVSGSSVTVARTPAMQDKDHVAYAHTTLAIAADGTVTGRTTERNTGVFGLALRAMGDRCRMPAAKMPRGSSSKASIPRASAAST